MLSSMAGGGIEIDGLTKRFGSRVAVDDLTVTVHPGRVTGFLGPNGSGKTTTLRCLLGLTRPTAGTATVLGVSYRSLPRPMESVGALIEPRARHPGRTARGHLTALAQSNALPGYRVDELIELVGLGAVADRRVGGFSLGMGQRLGIAAALLGDPEVLVLDEPVNGLDPEGIRWIRQLLRDLAADGRTIFVSSHLMSEMALTADNLIVIGRGRLIAETSVDEFVARASKNVVLVRSPELDRLRALLAEHGATGFEPRERGAVEVYGLSAEAIGDLAATQQIAIHELTPEQASLEEAFMDLTRGDLEYVSLVDGGGVAV